MNTFARGMHYNNLSSFTPLYTKDNTREKDQEMKATRHNWQVKHRGQENNQRVYYIKLHPQPCKNT